MRVKLTLQAVQKRTLLPLNYQHAVTALIYETIGSSSARFAEHLHGEGFIADGRVFKLFTFSRLTPRRGQVVADQLLLVDPTVSLQVSSPVTEFVEHFVSGLFQTQIFIIANGRFILEGAETLPAPVFAQSMKFRCLAPITESARDAEGRVRFLSLEDDWSEIMQRNLSRKYCALYGGPPADCSLHWVWDQEYIRANETLNRRLSVLADIRGIKVRGWLVPFTVEGNPELIELGYEVGFGSRNSTGFGMAEFSTANKSGDPEFYKSCLRFLSMKARI